ncbi:hypothetical protein VTK26DRAFT_4308 [Humicola hyalothermophila]
MYLSPSKCLHPSFIGVSNRATAVQSCGERDASLTPQRSFMVPFGCIGVYLNGRFVPSSCGREAAYQIGGSGAKKCSWVLHCCQEQAMPTSDRLLGRRRVAGLVVARCLQGRADWRLFGRSTWRQSLRHILQIMAGANPYLCKDFSCGRGDPGRR